MPEEKNIPRPADQDEIKHQPKDRQLPANSKEKLDERLDEAVEESFPASDPVSVKITK